MIADANRAGPAATPFGRAVVVRPGQPHATVHNRPSRSTRLELPEHSGEVQGHAGPAGRGRAAY